MIKELRPEVVITDLMGTGLNIIKEYLLKDESINFFIISYVDESIVEKPSNVKEYSQEYPELIIIKL